MATDAAHRDWLSRAAALRRRLSERPGDSDLLSEADELVRQAQQLGIRPGANRDLGWERKRP